MYKSVLAFLIACGAAAGAGACPDDPAWKAEVLERLNSIRGNGGQCGDGTAFAPVARPVRWNMALEGLAVRQAAWMAGQGRLMHLGPGGETVGERARQADYVYEQVSETVAAGFDRVDQVIDAWRASARHCRILLDPDYTELGLGCTRSQTGPWWTLALGRPRPSASPLAQAQPFREIRR